MSYNSLNLLPDEDLRSIGYEKLSRFFIIIFVNLAVIIIVGAVLMLPSYFFITFQGSEEAQQVETAKKSIEAKRVQEAEEIIRATNAKLKILSEEGLQARSLSSYLEALSRHVPSGLRVEQLSYGGSDNKMELAGNATTRDIFLSFLSSLRTDASFPEVHSPVTNILRDKDVDFILSLTLSN